jgi:sulfur relay (sulfurtransferase) DsrC/TusE family protein
MWISNWHFQKQHFKILNEVMKENPNLSEIKLLCKIHHDFKILEGLKEYYKLFQKEYPEIKMNIKIITNKKLGKEMHDRFYYTKGQAWNFIELDSVLRNTRADIHLLPKKDLEKNMENDFLKYWNDSETLFMMDGWDKIRKASEEYSEHLKKLNGKQ